MGSFLSLFLQNITLCTKDGYSAQAWPKTCSWTVISLCTEGFPERWTLSSNIYINCQFHHTLIDSGKNYINSNDAWGVSYNLYAPVCCDHYFVLHQSFLSQLARSLPKYHCHQTSLPALLPSILLTLLIPCCQNLWALYLACWSVELEIISVYSPAFTS